PGHDLALDVELARALDGRQEGRLDEVLGLAPVGGEVPRHAQELGRGAVEDLSQAGDVAVRAEAPEGAVEGGVPHDGGGLSPAAPTLPPRAGFRAVLRDRPAPLERDAGQVRPRLDDLDLELAGTARLGV